MIGSGGQDRRIFTQAPSLLDTLSKITHHVE